MRPSTLTRTLALAGALLGHAAHAGMLQTAPAFPDFVSDDGYTLYCQVRNVGSAPTTITSEAWSFGDLKSSSGPIVLAPGHGASHPGGTGDTCRFTFTGSTKSVRAMALFFDGTNYVAAVPAR
jgi:hypothetical protein